MDPALGSAASGLASAASWGAGDFTGGLASRRSSALRVTFAVQVVGLTILLALALLLGEPIPALARLVWALAAGMSGAVGLLSLYAALASGRMGIAAPITAVVGLIIPIVFSSIVEGTPGPLKFSGFAIALGGIALVSGEKGSASRRTLWLALLSGVGFGGFYVLLAQVGGDAFAWPLVVSRVGSMLLIGALLLAGREQGTRAWAPAWMLLLAGVLDTGGNAFFLLARNMGRLDVAAVLSSLYPAMTALLARIVLKEMMTRHQIVGVALMLVAIVMVAWPA